MQTTIALCVLTHRRPLGLHQLLAGIAQLDVDGLALDLRVVVVDNDVEASARGVVEDVAEEFPFPLTYEVEPKQGIPIARNRAVAAAGDVELIGWLDDDEVPMRDWLRHLLAAYRGTGADVVLGPSVPRFPSGTPSWIVRGGFFDRVRFPSGTRIPPHYARTSGVLLRRAAMPPRPEPFNEELRFTGGSDRELFVEMARLGATFVWVDEAQVVEHVPASRARAGWILQRAFRIGNSRSIALVLDGAGLGRRLKRCAAGLVKVGKGAVRMARGIPAGRAGVVRGALECWNGAGLASGALGYRYQEYRSHHGS
ncbi:MAG: glycosyltransferase [Actinomycetes bacterium]